MLDAKGLERRAGELLEGVKDRAFDNCLIAMRRQDRDRDRVMGPTQVKIMLEKHKVRGRMNYSMEYHRFLVVVERVIYTVLESRKHQRQQLFFFAQIPVGEILEQLQDKFEDKSFPGQTNYEDLMRYLQGAKAARESRMKEDERMEQQREEYEQERGRRHQHARRGKNKEKDKDGGDHGGSKKDEGGG